MADQDVSPDLLARINTVPLLADRVDVENLSGGLTNRNLKVTTASGTFVARLSSEQSSLLAIDRVSEHANSVAAAKSGAAPEVVAYSPGASILAVRFIEGRTWTNADVLAPRNAGPIASACRTLHAGPRFANDFNMLQLQPQYLKIVQERGFRLPDGYLDFAPQVSALTTALQARPIATVPCNNDLLAANFIEAPNRLWLIDFEYSGNNDPFFELGNIWSEAAGDPEQLERLVTAYVGHPSRALTARAQLWGLIAKYGWMLWASIQDGTSRLDFDFWSWGLEKYDRAVLEFNSPDFGRLLRDAAAGA